MAVGIELLADPTRRHIVALIARGVRRPSRIATALGLSRPAVSRQLRLLAEAGLIEAHGYPADRRGCAYHFNPKMTLPMIAWLVGTEVGRPGPLRDSRSAHPVSTLDPGGPAGTATESTVGHDRSA